MLKGADKALESSVHYFLLEIILHLTSKKIDVAGFARLMIYVYEGPILEI